MAALAKHGSGRLRRRNAEVAGDRRQRNIGRFGHEWIIGDHVRCMSDILRVRCRFSFSEEGRKVHNIPEGFVLLQGYAKDGFMDRMGPFYIRRGDDRSRIGLRVEAHHCNFTGNAHGGMVTTLCDVVTGFTIGEASGTNRMVTISLNTDFLGGVPLGCWFDGWAEIQRKGGSLLFARCELYADGKLAARASGIFKLLRPKSAG